jgi:hypothetical protein
MMTIMRILGAAVLAVGVASPAIAQQGGAAEQKSRQEIEAFMSKWVTAYNHGDGKRPAGRRFFRRRRPWRHERRSADRAHRRERSQVRWKSHGLSRRGRADDRPECRRGGRPIHGHLQQPAAADDRRHVAPGARAPARKLDIAGGELYAAVQPAAAADGGQLAAIVRVEHATKSLRLGGRAARWRRRSHGKARKLAIA